jgi:hypothetical protein
MVNLKLLVKNAVMKGIEYPIKNGDKLNRGN